MISPFFYEKTIKVEVIMSLSVCNAAVDQFGRELVEHGTTAFPIACYDDNLVIEEVPWHWHEELEAGIITEGTAIVTVGHDKLTVHSGEGFFINGGALHGAYSADGGLCRIHSLVFHPRLIGGTADSVFYQRYLRPLLDDPTLEWIFLRPDGQWHQKALTAIERAWQACTQEPPGFEFRVRSALSELVWQLNTHHSQAGQTPSSKALRDAERVKRMLACIHENYGSELNTRRIAASAAISDSECLRCFRSTIGTSPIQYLKHYRIRQAALQISSTNDRIAEIAVRCGFQDMSYFTKSFRELKGCTPTEYRANSKSQP